MYYYSHNIGDFDRDTRHLTRVERSIYRDMIELYIVTEKPITSDEAALCRKLLARSEEEVLAVKQILREYFIATDDGWHHSGCDAELNAFWGKQGNRSKGGKVAKQRRDDKKAAALTISSSAGAVLEHDVSTANQEPVSNNQEPNSFTPPIGGVAPGNAEGAQPTVRKVRKNATAKTECPHSEIIALYHEILPMCPRVLIWSGARQKNLCARWNQSPGFQTLDFWRDFFTSASSSKLLMGGITGKDGAPPFRADLEWMVKSANFIKIIEGRYV